MAIDYPYVLSNNRVGPLLDAIGQAARPAKFTHELLKTLGFSSSNDRAFVPLFRKLGLIGDNGVPTDAYDSLRDRQLRKSIMAQRMRDLYADMFAANTEFIARRTTRLKG